MMEVYFLELNDVSGTSGTGSIEVTVTRASSDLTVRIPALITSLLANTMNLAYRFRSCRFMSNKIS